MFAKIADDVAPFACPANAKRRQIKAGRLRVMLQVRVVSSSYDVKAHEPAVDIVAIFHNPPFWASLWDYYGPDAPIQDIGFISVPVFKDAFTNGPKKPARVRANDLR
jgi:hypothetical protein